MPEFPSKTHQSDETPGDKMPVEDVKLILDRLGVAAGSDQRLRSAMQQFASWLGQVCGAELAFGQDGSSAMRDGSGQSGTAGSDDRGRSFDQRDWFAELRTVVPRRTRLKAECCRWVPKREAQLRAGADFHDAIAPTDRDLIDRARTMPHCYLWMLDPNHGVPESINAEDLAGCYETLADACELLLHLLDVDVDDPHLVQETLFLLAESVSAARYLVLTANNRPDPDVDAAFQCLRTLTRERQIYIPRHMRVDDPADATLWRERRERIDELSRRIDESFDETRQLVERLDDLRTSAEHLVEGVNDNGNGDVREHLAGSCRDLLGRDINRVRRLCDDELLDLCRQALDHEPPRELVTLIESLTGPTSHGRSAADVASDNAATVTADAVSRLPTTSE